MNRYRSQDEKDLQATVRAVCEREREKLERARKGHTSKGAILSLTQQSIAQAAKRADPQKGLIVSMLPSAVPGYWMLIEHGLLAMIGKELQRRVKDLPLWESAYDPALRNYRWIPRAIITADFAEQIVKDRDKTIHRTECMRKVYELIADELRGTNLVLGDIEDQIRPQIKQALAS